jgi:hypothetical protein
MTIDIVLVSAHLLIFTAEWRGTLEGSLPQTPCLAAWEVPTAYQPRHDESWGVGA